MKIGLKTFSALALTAAALTATASDLALKYNFPAKYFEETLVIGNGNLGAVIYGGIVRDRMSLNDITLWTGGPDTTVYSPGA